MALNDDMATIIAPESNLLVTLKVASQQKLSTK